MAIPEHIEIFKKGPQYWNAWRDKNPDIRPDLSDINFEEDVQSYGSVYDLPEFNGYNLSFMNLNRISARNSYFMNCSLAGSDINFSDICFSFFQNCNFEKASLAVTKIGSAEFHQCDLSPRFKTMTLMRFKINYGICRSQNEKTLQRRTNL